MTEDIQKKNIAIAEMMGARYEAYYKNDTTGFEMAQMVGECMKNLRIYSHMPVGSSVKNGIEISNLCFHSDFNWQFEALDFIVNLSDEEVYNQYLIMDNSCSISHRNAKTGETYCNILHYSKEENTKEAIFEALYEFSQYIKEKS